MITKLICGFEFEYWENKMRIKHISLGWNFYNNNKLKMLFILRIKGYELIY